MADKFDTVVESTLKRIYNEMLNGNSSQLSSTEKDATENAVETVENSNPGEQVDPNTKRLADLAKRRKAQLNQVAPAAANKIQTQISQPITR